MDIVKKFQALLLLCDSVFGCRFPQRQIQAFKRKSRVALKSLTGYLTEEIY